MASTPAPTASTPKNITPQPRSTTSTPIPSSTPNPFANMTQRTPSNSSTPTNQSVRYASEKSLKQPLAETNQTPSVNSPRPPPTKVSKPTSEAQSLPEWEDQTLSHLFRVTLDEGKKSDANGHKLFDLPGQRQELQDDGLPRLLSRDRLDGIILEAASMVPHNKSILDYLLPCWKRILKAQKGLRGYASEKDTVVKEALRLCMSYMIFAVEVPDLFE